MEFCFSNEKYCFPQEFKVDQLQNASNISISSLGVAIVSPATPISGNHVDCDVEDGYTTPTSEEYRIPASEFRKCPGAPKKKRPEKEKYESTVVNKLPRRLAIKSRRRRESVVFLKNLEFELSDFGLSTTFGKFN